MSFRKRETIIEARKRQEDLEFQLMELETRYEAELEQAELNFQNERICANQNAKIRQVNIDRFKKSIRDDESFVLRTLCVIWTNNNNSFFNKQRWKKKN